MLLLQPISSAATLIQFLVNTYYAHLTSVLIVYETSNNFNNVLQQHYLDAVQNAFDNQSHHRNSIGLQWINVNYLNDTEEDFEEHMLKVVDIVSVEGFITILTNTSRFLHARYYATRYAKLRLKDKIYLFLCQETENPKEMLSTEILQFYPHHLMVIPAATIHILSNKDHNQKKNIKVTKTTATPTPTSQITQKPNIKQKTSLAKRTTRATATKNFNITNVAMDIIGIVDVNTTTSSFTNFCTNDKNNKYRDINFELWTQQYVGAEGNLNAIHLDTYISSSGGGSGGGGSVGGTFEKTTELYPNKLWNLQQRTMRIGSLTYVPYVKTYYVSPGEGDVDSFNSKGPNKTVSFMGVEAELIKTFCQIRNCHLRIKPYPADNWGIIYENGSADGMLGDLYYQHTEMAIGCIYNWYNDITETSQFIARSAVTILGPGPAQFSRWRINIMPFSLSLWIFLIFTLISCSLMFHFIQLTTFRYKHPNRAANSNKYERIKYYEKTLLDIFAIFIQQPSADTGLHRVATRIFLAFLLCATITLENTYSGQLKSLLTMPLFSEPVDTMHKWSLTNWKWGAPSIIWKQTVENSHLAMEQRLSNKFEVRDYGYLYNASFWDNYGLAVERIYSGSFSFGDYITAPALETKIVPKDDLYFDWTRAVAIRGWPLMPLLDRHILYCLETGIYIFWEKQNSYKYLDHQVQDILATLATGYRPKSPPQILSIEHISGPLFILLFGNLMAFVVLLVELSFGYRLKKSFQQIKTTENSE